MTDKKTKAAKPIDIADFDTGVASDKGFDFELLHPTNNKPVGVFITVLGKHSQVYRDHIRDQINERMHREAVAERKGKTADAPTAEIIERNALELLVLCTTGWFTASKDKDGNLIDKVDTFPYRGEQMPFNVSNVLKVYSEQIWVRAQVDGAIHDLENFIKG